ncbi:MAG: hypothetical protein WC519_00900 [Parcubacteria group bacterium]
MFFDFRFDLNRHKTRIVFFIGAFSIDQAWVIAYKVIRSKGHDPMLADHKSCQHSTFRPASMPERGAFAMEEEESGVWRIIKINIPEENR